MLQTKYISMKMKIKIQKLIGEATAYDKKEMLERSKPKSWLKSVSPLPMVKEVCLCLA